jgi:hypothetical protein
MAENEQTWDPEDTTKDKSWQNIREQSSSVPLTFEHPRQPSQWANNTGRTERMVPTTGYTTAAAPEPDPNPSEDGDDNDSRNNQDRPSRHYRGGGRFPGRYPGNNGNNDRPTRYSGGGGPPDNPEITVMMIENLRTLMNSLTTHTGHLMEYIIMPILPILVCC